MKGAIRMIASAVVLAACLMLAASYVHAASLRGQVVDAQNRPLRGLTISLVSPIPHIGTIGPVATTSEGVFLFPVVERRGDAAYELRVYWGTKLLHTEKLMITTDMDIGTIRMR